MRITNAIISFALVFAHGLVHTEGANVRVLASKDAWEFCAVSSECFNGCCSKEYSDDGRLKCTPGGTPSRCVGGNPTMRPTPRPTSGRPTPPPTRPYRGDWEFCAASEQCINSCCSRQYSDDGRLKCTPGGSRDQCV